MKYQFNYKKIEKCWYCPFLSDNEDLWDTCRLDKQDRQIKADTKPNWCPLVEVLDE